MAKGTGQGTGRTEEVVVDGRAGEEGDNKTGFRVHIKPLA